MKEACVERGHAGACVALAQSALVHALHTQNLSRLTSGGCNDRPCHYSSPMKKRNRRYWRYSLAWIKKTFPVVRWLGREIPPTHTFKQVVLYHRAQLGRAVAHVLAGVDAEPRVRKLSAELFVQGDELLGDATDAAGERNKRQHACSSLVAYGGGCQESCCSVVKLQGNIRVKLQPPPPPLGTAVMLRAESSANCCIG